VSSGRPKASIASPLLACSRPQGDLAAARPLYERALAIDEKVLGPEHPDTATDLSRLAGLVQDQATCRALARCTNARSRSAKSVRSGPSRNSQEPR
jgi:hypothetical protein